MSNVCQASLILIDLLCVYRIVGNFQAIKFSWNDDYKVFAGLIFEDGR